MDKVSKIWLDKLQRSVVAKQVAFRILFNHKKEKFAEKEELKFRRFYYSQLRRLTHLYDKVTNVLIKRWFGCSEDDGTQEAWLKSYVENYFEPTLQGIYEGSVKTLEVKEKILATKYV